MDHTAFIEHSNEMYSQCLPHVSIDCVIFGFDRQHIKVLLLRTKNQDLWGLPGGYVLKTESTDDAAHRVLHDRTGVKDIYLQQFATFGATHRSESFFASFPNDLWHKQRFVSIGYFALVNYAEVIPFPDSFSDACEWCDVQDLPPLMMDHRVIIDRALDSLRKQINYEPIGINLLGEKFTMPELQKLYEIILGKTLNRGNFYRKIIRFDILEKLDESRKGGAHKSPILYRFDAEKYTAALATGLQGDW
ncbi:MAG: NUDIX domain-containing protein [Chitinophagaceae bacterium]|nr:MAG: NUDIX domain-containing protein [Chitinophagaceae bacterium]